MKCMERNGTIRKVNMLKINKYYLATIDTDITRKPRFYYSDDELDYGDEVITHNKVGDKTSTSIGHVVGTVECSPSTIAKIVYQVGGYFPLAKCEKPKTYKDIFVMMGICNKEDSPMTILEKLVMGDLVEKYANKKTKD